MNERTNDLYSAFKILQVDYKLQVTSFDTVKQQNTI